MTRCGPGVNLTPRVFEQLKHQPVANQMRRMQSDRRFWLQQLVGALVGCVEFPPELEP